MSFEKKVFGIFVKSFNPKKSKGEKKRVDFMKTQQQSCWI